jgi:glycosyltransferase involved in cell wall biosynthesis
VQAFKNRYPRWHAGLQLYGRLGFALLKQAFNRRIVSEAGSQELPGVLHINTYAQGGGAAAVMDSLQQGWKERGGLAYRFVSRTTDSPQQRIWAFPRRTDWEYDYDDAFGFQDLGFDNSAFLEGHEAYQNASIVHLHNLHNWYFSYLNVGDISRNKKIVWTLHDMHPLTGHCAHAMHCEKWKKGCGNCPDLGSYPPVKKDTTRLVHFTKNWVYQWASPMEIVCPSQWLAEKAKGVFEPRHKVRVIYNGVDTQKFSPFPKHKARELLHLNRDTPMVLFVAGDIFDNPFKGGEYLKALLEDSLVPNSIQFFALGAREDIHQKINFPNLNVLPYVKEPEQMALWYAAADVLLFPSVAENAPLTILEAMACGLPVVCFPVGGIPELISHKETGFMHPEMSATKLAEGIAYILSDSKIAQDMAMAARKKVCSHFSLEKMVNSYVQLYRELN